MVAPLISTTGVLTLSSISVTARVESVSKARRTRPYMLATLAMYCAGLVGSCGSGSFTTGLGFRSQPLDSCRRFSRSRTLVKYWSRRARSAAPTLRSRSADLVGDGVENGPAGIEFRDLRFDLFGAALNEHLAEDAGGALFRRDGDAVAGPGEGARPCVDGQRERGKARLIADAFGDVLVERDGVAERTAGRVRGRRQEADVRNARIGNATPRLPVRHLAYKFRWRSLNGAIDPRRQHIIT